MRVCTYCNKLKLYDSSKAIVNTKASGFRGARCWECYKEYNLEIQRQYRATPEGAAAHRESSRRRYATQEGREAARNASLNWQRNNLGKHNAISMNYYAAKQMRVMLWTEHEAIANLYKEANAKGLQVDHIYPIQSKLVSGLHVLANLQLLTPFENASKGNKFQ